VYRDTTPLSKKHGSPSVSFVAMVTLDRHFTAIGVPVAPVEGSPIDGEVAVHASTPAVHDTPTNRYQPVAAVSLMTNAPRVSPAVNLTEATVPAGPLISQSADVTPGSQSKLTGTRITGTISPMRVTVDASHDAPTAEACAGAVTAVSADAAKAVAISSDRIFTAGLPASAQPDPC
jgi:hypothetical protein